MRAGLISDALVDAFCIVGEGCEEGRYRVMGALMVARDYLPDEMPEPPEVARGVER